MTIGELEKYLNDYLKVSEFEDYTFNGLNIGNRQYSVKGVITATDYDRKLVDIALGKGANVIVVHHGIWWGKPFPIVDNLYEEIAYLVKNDIALMAYHLPLDAHMEVGNNAYILSALGIVSEQWNTLEVGFYVDTCLTVSDIVAKLQGVVGIPKDVWEFRGGSVKRLAVVSGSGGSFINTLVALGVDTFITGEISYPQWREFRREKINVLLYGHYRSEIGGPILLAKHITDKLDVPAKFVDIYERAM